MAKVQVGVRVCGSLLVASTFSVTQKAKILAESDNGGKVLETEKRNIFIVQPSERLGERADGRSIMESLGGEKCSLVRHD